MNDNDVTPLADGHWSHARWTESHAATPDMTRLYIQPGTTITEAPCLDCGEVVVHVPAR